ncbi:hypothetical protein LH462_06835 [Laribacter hongkongensis]|uniref:HTH cro/C1-type domain-containing protein n=1 Tax=Laribacter hongkongensis TaxID=168471 RepID=A0ABD4SQS3_9NEIS|nr:hypothetical protein [Laribacter hongkongensis]MCG9025174.1 hypothetical protein [Laribacter hongkongensis]MCG9099762.1 hypothetical protein [Laribacter hongkongensis]MCG9103436.1 hypothetical protein [Laribacter hongkongensis]MCG9111240.1 hypothetical protein [Laribacter hongkongensis]MCG9118183.1 hypothetical protein [Laribacter hongkongensis]
MMTSYDWICLAKQRIGVESDYAMAKVIGVTRHQISKIKTGKSNLGDTTAIRLAQFAHFDALKIISSLNFERAKSPSEKAFWEQIYCSRPDETQN